MSGAVVITIAEKWRTYLEQVVPKDAGPVQIQECRRAFFGGFWSCLQTFQCLSMLEENEALRLVDELDREAKKFRDEVGTDAEKLGG